MPAKPKTTQATKPVAVAAKRVTASAAVVKREPDKNSPTAPPKAPAAPAKKVAPPAPTKIAKPASKATPQLPPSSKKAAVANTKPEKAKKAKMVRDSFTFPKAEYDVLDALKARAIKLGYALKKTELLRAGIKALADMSDATFVTTTQSVPSLKTGRPTKQ